MRILTLARNLRRRKARERERLFVAEGVRCVEELVASTLTIRGAIVGPQLSESPRGLSLAAALATRAEHLEEVSFAEFASAAETESPQGVLAIGVVPEFDLSSLAQKSLRVLVLDAVQDPGNVGTIVRTAAALGASATFAMPGTVDLWNAKVVRSAMGALFRHPTAAFTWPELDALRDDHPPFTIWGSDASGSPLGAHHTPERLALVVGNEGSGLSSEAQARAVHTVQIPISNVVESLNVAVATGILLHALRP